MGYTNQDNTEIQKIFARIPNSVEIYTGPPDIQKSTKLPSFPGEQLIFSQEGKYFCSVRADQISIYDTDSESEVFKIELKNVVLVNFSPFSKFLVTLREARKTQDGNYDQNLEIWNLENNGQQVVAYQQIKINQDHWPLLHWMQQDQYVVNITTNTLHIHSKEDNFQESKKVQIQGITSIAGSAGLDPAIVVYIPESKGQPAFIQLYNFQQLLQCASSTKEKNMQESDGSTNEAVNGNQTKLNNNLQLPQPICKKSFYRSNEVIFRWNSKGTALLAVVQSYYDPTNTSYYGEQKLYFFSKDGNVDTQVPLPKEGPTHDAQWSPRGDMFCVISGFVPSKACVYNERCEQIFDLGAGPYNTIKWNAHSRFLCLAGFGSLPGDITFYDRKADGKFKQMGTIRNPSTYSEWSPCGRYFMTAINTPRLRVDNKIKVFTYYGEKIYEQQYQVLYQCKFRPFESRLFPDRPSSPQRIRDYFEKKQLADQQSSQNSTEGQTILTGKAYIPPHLRNRPQSSGPKVPNGFSLAYEEIKSQQSTQKSHQQSSIPGAEILSKQQNKNLKKRESKKKRQNSEDGDAQLDSAYNQINSNENVQKSKQEENQQQDKISIKGSNKDEKLKGLNSQARNFQKKLQQIHQLKQKQGQGTLEGTQVQKITSEGETQQKLQDVYQQIEQLNMK